MHRLLLASSGAAFASLTANDLLWSPSGQPSSVDTTLGPRLEGIGLVPDLNVDLVRVAGLVFFCDRTVPRPRDLRRTIDLDVAVSAPARWAPVSERLSALLGFLTGDEWSLTWSRRREPKLQAVAETQPADLTLLFSGGADSTSGAAMSISQGSTPLLVSHADWSSVTGQQNRSLTALGTALGVTPSSVRWRFARERRQVGSGVLFPEEPSRRSRSFLFVALGLAVSAVTGTDLHIAENGFTSLNPPLSAESGGALSTRTTHPTFIRGLVETLAEIGLPAPLQMPFADLTKGEVFGRVRDELGVQAAGTLLSATHSCGKPQRVHDYPPDTPCGACVGCLVRRGAFIAAGLSDSTIYLEQDLPAARRAQWLTDTRRATYNALQHRLQEGFGDADVLDLGLPDDADLDQAAALINRGLAELATVTIR